MRVRYSNSKVIWLGEPFKYQTFWTISRLFSGWFSDHRYNTGPFDNRTQIYHLNSKLVRHSDCHCNLKSFFVLFFRRQSFGWSVTFRTGLAHCSLYLTTEISLTKFPQTCSTFIRTELTVTGKGPFINDVIQICSIIDLSLVTLKWIFNLYLYALCHKSGNQSPYLCDVIYAIVPKRVSAR